jgi:alpha-glucosidase
VTTTHLQDVSATPGGLRARLVGDGPEAGETFEVDVLGPDVVRLRVSRGGAFDEAPTAAVCADLAGSRPQVGVELGDGRAVVRAAGLVVTVGLAPWTVEVHRPDGSPVLRERGAAGALPPYAVAGDGFVLQRGAAPEDQVYGLGEKAGGGNRRGRSFTLWNTDVLDPDASGAFARGYDPSDPRADNTSAQFDPYYVSIPFLHHRDARTGDVAGSFVDNGYRGRYDLTAPDGFEIAFDGGQWCEYVLAGPAMPDVVGAYTWLTGRTALPPVWALGYQQCRWHVYRQDEVVALAARMREAGVPCDALWLDIDHMSGYRVFTWDRERFDDPAALVGALAEHGMRLVTIIDPGVKVDPGWDVFDDAVARDLLCRTADGEVYVGQVWPGDTAFPDFTLPETRQWWGGLNAAHVRSGLAGIWNDMNEPATGNVVPDGMLFDHGRAPHARFHNQYALLMAMGTVAGLRAELPGQRPFVLSRAGSAGIQRYAATWTGDNQARWDHLAVSVPMSTGLGLSGQAFVGSDIGGFAGSADPELFVRWMQYGVLTPFARNHQMTGQQDRYPWAFGPEVLDVVREAVRLRYRLLPYLYSAFVEAATTGAPVQRPLVLDHQHDDVAAACEDQFTLGRDLLVAPVLEPGATTRRVYLPAGQWWDLGGGVLLDGGRHVELAAPPERIPLLLRAGAVLPMWPDAPATAAGHQPDVVDLHVAVPSATRRPSRTVSVLQEDDGLTTAAERGAYLRTAFTVERSADRLVLTATVSGDGYPEHRRGAFRLHLHGATTAEVLLDGAPADADGEAWVLPTGAAAFVVEVTLV